MKILSKKCENEPEKDEIIKHYNATIFFEKMLRDTFFPQWNVDPSQVRGRERVPLFATNPHICCAK